MAKLRFLVNGHSLGEFNLDKERLTIGRRPSCDIQIDNLTISGEHAAVVTMGNSSYVEDLNSTNGTLVNAKSIQKHVLLNKDVIEFGHYQLHYSNENPVNKQIATTDNSDGFEKTVMTKLNPSHPITEQEIKPVVMESTEKPIFKTANLDHVVENEFDLSSKMSMLGRLKVLNGKSAGRELNLDKAFIRLGKPGIQVAVIVKRSAGYFITHIEGEQYPTVNGASIGVQAYKLAHQDEVELAGTKMAFDLL